MPGVVARHRLILLAAVPTLSGCGSDGLIDLLALPRDAGFDDANGTAPTDAARTEGSADASLECDGGACPCGLTDCGGVCVDLQNDPNHCGDCATGLLHHQYCNAGQRQCLPGFTFCNGGCHDFTSDPDHCGGCDGAACNVGEKCENGTCGAGACGAGLTGCPATNGRLACVDLSRGSPYCGSCTTICGPDQVCAGGSCRGYSPATPCTTCPCATDCTRTQGSPSVCCPGVAGGAQPICVHDLVCP